MGLNRFTDNIQKDLNSSPSEVANRYYADNMQTQNNGCDGIYIGVVEDNNDPLKLGRVKVTIANCVFRTLINKGKRWTYY